MNKMKINNVIKEAKKIFNANGFEYSWFPGEDSFKKGDLIFIIFSDDKTKNCELGYYKSLSTPNELTFSFNNVEFVDKEKNILVKFFTTIEDKSESLKLLVEYVIDNLEWFQNLTKEDIVPNKDKR